MICETCKKNRIDNIIAESKKAMKRYTAKLREEKYEDKKCESEGEKSSEPGQG